MGNLQPKTVSSAETKTHAPSPAPLGAVQGDERNPGSFFRIPGLPVPGKTTWRLAE